MTELERKAVLGDKQAQKKCTEKGIILPCPCCGGYSASCYDISAHEEEPYCCCCVDCGLSIYGKTEEIVIEKWNTRPTPPVGRCDQCKYWRGEPGEEYAPCPMCDGVMCADDYCKNFIYKE